MKKLIKASATILATLSIAVPGIVSAQTGTIHLTGPDSSNSAEFNNDVDYKATNNNSIGVNSNANQNATSGDVHAKDNTTAGDAMSGDADNSHTVRADVSVDNGSTSGAGMMTMPSDNSSANISNTGPDSDNTVTVNNDTDVTITNNNNLSVSNSVNQSASTGDAHVSHNTTGGNATSGSASNTSTSEFTLSVSN